MGNVADFEVFYEQHRDRLVLTLSGLIDADESGLAADAVDEAMARAYARWRRLQKHPEPAGWVFVTARNICRRRLRRRRHRITVIADEPVIPPAGEIWQVVAGLPVRQREAIVLRHIAGLTERGVGEAMGITRGTVSRTLRDAYQALRLALGEEETIEERT
jgi:DNA-directed RNA polymerase specialized sigma24 family protein